VPRADTSDPANPAPAIDPEQRQKRLHGVVKRVLDDPAYSGERVLLPILRCWTRVETQEEIATDSSTPQRLASVRKPLPRSKRSSAVTSVSS
jgi:hypothetical protein